ncbi:MAG: hypothetical protein P8I96_06285 [Opitutae bacterium]|jgi:hypothetical protein|nr:hypothetical protein [Opitutae bacterium]
MSTINEIKNIPEQYRKHAEELVSLFRKHQVRGMRSLVLEYRRNRVFQSEWTQFWHNMAKDEGGKLSLTTIGILIGASLGGVGIAAMGTAVGMPLAVVLGLSGFLTGSKIDSLKLFASKKTLLLPLGKETYLKLNKEADALNVSVTTLVESVLELHCSTED